MIYEEESDYIMRMIKEAARVLFSLIFGKKFRKLFVYSHASVINVPEFPTRILPPMAFRIPPTEMVGSKSASRRMCEIMEVVVVFP